MSKEHVLAAWMLPLLRQQCDVGEVQTVKFKGDYEIKTSSIRQGHPGTIQLRHVCRTCNNTWISGIDTRAKEVLTALIQGNACALSRRVLAGLALWACKVSMVAQSQDPQAGGVPSSHRRYLFVKRAIPPGWQVWLARNDSEKAFRSGVVYQTVDWAEPLGLTKVQTTTICVGRALLHVFSTVEPDRPMTYHVPQLHQIWPNPQEELKWPPDVGAGDEFIYGLIIGLKETIVI